LKLLTLGRIEGSAATSHFPPASLQAERYAETLSDVTENLTM